MTKFNKLEFQFQLTFFASDISTNVINRTLNAAH